MSRPSRQTTQSASELKRQVELERQGNPFLVYRPGAGATQELRALGGRDRITIGRDPSAFVSLVDDPAVSLLHAELEYIGGTWVLVDDGLSRNGTLVNDDPVIGRARLRDRDVIAVGSTEILYRDPGGAPARGTTAPARDLRGAKELTEMQRKILVALCRPLASEKSFASPAPNKEIGEEVHLSVDAVKAHLRTLFAIFDVAGLPQIRKRTELAERALRSGAIRASELVE